MRSPTTPRLPQNRHRMANDEPNGIGGRGGQESRIFGENAIQSGQRRSILSGSGSESHEFDAKATKNDHVGPPKRNNSGLECVFRVRKRLNSVICGADTVYTGCSVRSGYSGCAMDGSARRCLLAILPSLFLVAGPGCSRKFFRERADADVEGIITQKNRFPAWSVKNWHVYPDPRARFADPFNPDRPPYPPDDYATRVLSPNPQHPHKKAGVGRVDGEGYLHLLEQWDIENRAGETGAEPPEPYMPLPPDAPATFRKQEPAGTIVPAGGITLPSPAATFSPAVGQWVSAKPRFTPPLIDAAPAGPRITEVRNPVVLVSNETEPMGPPAPAVPAAATVPVQAPRALPELPIAQPPGAQARRSQRTSARAIACRSQSRPQGRTEGRSRAVRFAVRLGRSRSVSASTL